MKRKRGFTLIELLIVVAIVSILAAVAVPNFLEAQVRAKVSRVKSDMRSMVLALETYAVDNNGYPPHRDQETCTEIPYPRLTTITTPIAYMTRIPGPDPFAYNGDDNQEPAGTTGFSWTNFHSYACRSTPHALLPFRNGHTWLLRSRGTDSILEADGVRNKYFQQDPNDDWLRFVYDPTNGTVSAGEIFRTRIYNGESQHPFGL